jgi:hypothetical protein
MNETIEAEAPTRTAIEMLIDCQEALLRLELPLVSAPSAYVPQLAARAVEIAEEIDALSDFLGGLEPAEEQEASTALLLAAMHINARLARGGMEPHHAQIAAMRAAHLLAKAIGRVQQIWVPTGHADT